MGRDLHGLTTDTETAAPAVDSFAAFVAWHRDACAKQAAEDAARKPAPPHDCATKGYHLWERDGLKCFTGQPLRCVGCGARAREGFEGDLFAEFGYGPPPPVPTAPAAERAA